MNPMLQEFLKTLIRAFLLWISGWLVKHGIFKESDMEGYVTAASLFLITVGWAWWSRYKARKKLLTSLTMSPGVTENDVEHVVKNSVTPTVTTPSNTVPGIPDTNK